LPKEVGIKNAAKIGSIFFIATGFLAPLPFILGKFTAYYLPLILIWSVILVYSSIRLLTLASTVENIRKYERLITMSMILLPLALILETLSRTIGGLI
jgi:4-hydroxybenzoate polyprenyltransferase